MAYPNREINEGVMGGFYCSETIPIYSRVCYVAGATPDDVARIALADATDVGIGVAMEPGTVGKYISVRFSNAPGDQFGIAVTSIAQAAPVYAATDGKVTGSSAGGALLLGTAKTAGYGISGSITYTPA